MIPDFFRAVAKSEILHVRLPGAIRPWQHVLEPVSGYVELAVRLLHEGAAFGEAWNFGPSDKDAKPVAWLVERLMALWGNGTRCSIDTMAQAHEAHCLRLDSSKARTRLNGAPRWELAEGLRRVVDWHRAHLAGENMAAVSLAQIESYAGIGG